ncbi:MAG: cbb3-type cytochrome c oxidase subunit I [Syntrophotaleaceae bacterium]
MATSTTSCSAAPASPFFAALHYWLPSFRPTQRNMKVATVAWAVIFVGFNLLYFPMMLVGLRGMPRRYYDYLPQFQNLNVMATVGSWYWPSACC